MAETRTIPAANPGTDMKFRVTTTKEDFNLARDDFNIVIKNQYGRVTHRILKGDCFYDSEARWYFTVPNIKEGEHFAVFVGCYEDDDFDRQKRIWHDRQPLFIGTDDCSTADKKHACEGHSVQYEQVWNASIDGEDYLADCDGNYVYTSDGKRIQFSDRSSADGKVRLSMTGDEFLKLIEGREPNSEINTIPELMDAMQGISDDRTVKDEIEDEINEDTPERVTPEDLADFQV